ncbi:MAG: S8 family serine peptidase [Opitutaceae bacterium]|jgi:hypothetical protein
MRRSRPISLLLTAGTLLLLLIGLFFLTHPHTATDDAAVLTDDEPPLRRTLSAPAATSPDTDDTLVQSASVAELTQKLSTRLVNRAVRPHEAILIFKDADGYRRFLARAAQSGVIVTGQIDPLNILRVRIRAYDTFAAELVARAADYGGVSANAYIEIPPKPSSRITGRQIAVGNTLLTTLGVSAGTDTSAWGRGITIAVLDGGTLPDPTLGARLRYLDIGLGYSGTGEAGLHGTAVASLAAGSAADAPGISPAATILSIRVLDTDEKSDVFTVVQGIVAAVDAGAQIINLSLGGYSTSDALARTITYAQDHGVVIVAAAGNDGATRLTWPAADPRVVSVGATDATGSQASFSNSGVQLALTAPGIGLQTAGLNNERILFSGTSASAPVISGALAALMSQTPGLTAAQAVQILQTHADDGGAAGADPDYGSGVLDLGWVLSRNDPDRVDTAVSGYHYDSDSGALEVIVQNRSGQAAINLTLIANLNGTITNYLIPAVPPGQSGTVILPIDAATAASPITLRTRLDNPPSVTDAVPANNTRASLIDLSGR